MPRNIANLVVGIFFRRLAEQYNKCRPSILKLFQTQGLSSYFHFTLFPSINFDLETWGSQGSAYRVYGYGTLHLARL